MLFSLKQKIAGAIAAVLLVFGLGYVAGGHSNVKTEAIASKETITKENVTLQDNKKKKVREVVTVSPDGTKRTETTTTEETGTIKRTEDVTAQRDKTDVKTETANKNTVAALIGLNVWSLPTPIYGVSFTRQIYGPLNLGAFGLTNGTAGLSLGVSF